MSSLEHVGKIMRLVGWIITTLIILSWIILPLGRVLIDTKSIEEIGLVLRQVFWGTNGEQLFKLTIVFIGCGVILSIGNYIREYDLKKKIEKENRILGYLKLTGRTSLDDLAVKVGLSRTEAMEMLSELRQKKDIVFNIDGNEVYMPGYEREKPKEKETVKEVVKEVVKIPCPHCGTLNEVTTKRCINCGAPVKTK
jgi:predicted RNA-binding Zn-ribbon protein involved in translation (DUF1610 family)